MGKKKSAKKGGGDDFWDEAGEGIATSNGGVDDVDDDVPVAPRKSAFAAMTLEDTAVDEQGPTNGAEEADGPSEGATNDAEEKDFGGLMSMIKKSNASSKKDKKNKKNKKQQDDDIWDELGEDVSGNAARSRDDGEAAADEGQGKPSGPIEASAEDELPDHKAEKQKRKAGKGDDEGRVSGSATPLGDNDNDDDGTPRILSKKEKERLKKEKEKAKKKAQAAAKKGAMGGGVEGDKQADNNDVAVSVHAETDSPGDAKEADEEGEEGEEGEGGASAADKKKKKKKKAAQAKPEPVAAPPKKQSAAVQALQARIAAQRKAEEEARLADEEARRQEEEAERLEKEEAERKEAERQRRKEKEKAKKEQLKREGKLLTPKQKAEKAAAEARMQALMKSGAIKVEGLANRDKVEEGEDKERRRPAVDTRKKKKGPTGPPSKLAVPAPAAEQVTTTEEPLSLEPISKSEASHAPAAEAPAQQGADTPMEDVKDSWEVGSDDDIKDDWDAESEEESEKKASSAQTGKAATSTVNGTSAEAVAQGKGDGAAIKVEQKSDKDDQAEESDSDEDSSDDDSEDDSEEEEEELSVTEKMAAQRRAEAEKRRAEKHKAALAARSKEDLRSPICCIMGHVDTGKTKLLDKIRQTNVQEGEAGGITQQIGATYFPEETLRQKIAPIDPEGKLPFNIPGLLVIDTPGHESFTNLRTRGSSLCNIAILVVDIMHGLEQQTLESIRLLRDKKTPFIVALNKIDRLYGWQSTPDGGFRASLAKQNRATQNEFDDRLKKTIVAFAEQGLNAVPYYDNKNFARNVSLVPTSAHTGEGIPDMLQLLISLTQERMSEKLMYLSELECTVLEVKVIEGLGTTIDVILSNGVMHEGDKIVLCGLNGPIVTQVRALLTPQPLKEMRVKGTYVHHKMVKAALGVKISAPDLEKAIAGSRLLVVGEDDDEDDLKEEVMSDLTGLLHSIDKSGRGVCVQASTLGSLEALLEFLKQSKIPVNGINIGPVYKRDVMRSATMLEKQPDLAVMLCFDVAIDKDAEKLAEELGVKIFSAKIIYHLFDDFIAHQKRVLETKQKESADVAVWPCRLKVLAVFAKRSPLILGCEITAGDLRLGTPIAVKNKESGEIVNLGRVTSLEVNHKRLDVVTAKSAGAGVAVRIECAAYETPKMYGRHFTDQDELFSLITRQSIDTLKNLFWDNVSIEQKKTIKYLKGVLNIP